MPVKVSREQDKMENVTAPGIDGMMAKQPAFQTIETFG